MKPINFDPLWCSWFSGFVDGEGYFQLYTSKRRSFLVSLSIVLREDDRAIIEEIQENLGGNVYYLSYERDRVKGVKSCNQYKWRIANIHQIVETIIPLFDNYPLRSKKQISFHIWREAAIFKYNKQHLTDVGCTKFEEYWKALKEFHSKSIHFQTNADIPSHKIGKYQRHFPISNNI